jgi:hypothetical protein
MISRCIDAYDWRLTTMTLICLSDWCCREERRDERLVCRVFRHCADEECGVLGYRVIDYIQLFIKRMSVHVP